VTGQTQASRSFTSKATSATEVGVVEVGRTGLGLALPRPQTGQIGTDHPLGKYQSNFQMPVPDLTSLRRRHTCHRPGRIPTDFDTERPDGARFQAFAPYKSSKLPEKPFSLRWL